MSVKINVNDKKTIIDLNKNMTIEDLIKKLFTVYGTIYIDIDDILSNSKDKDVDLIRKNIMKLYTHQHLRKYIIEDKPNYINDSNKYNSNKLDTTKIYFIGRYGNVELAMIENYLKHNTSYIKNINDIFINYNPQKLIEYEKKYNSGEWLSCNNPEYTLIKICTNAGFYCSSNCADNESILKKFCELYLDGLRHITYISRYRDCKWWYLYINKFYEHKDEIQLNLDTMLNLTDQKNICFISYFADKVKDLYDNGKIFKLFKTRNFTFNKLYAIKSYITTYGNYPHSNWLETYNILCNSIDNLIKNEKIDLFIINAGCYGIPLANYIFTKHFISVIHDGHYLNGFFGILTSKNHLNLNDINRENFIEITQDFYRDIKGLEYWSNEGYWK